MFGVAKATAAGLSALESAGTAAWQSLEASAAQGNTWARLITETDGSIGRQDPGLPDFVARLRAAGIRVTNTNVVMYGEAGRDLGEIDVITDNALIQYKNGVASAQDVLAQVLDRSEPFVSRPVITFINGTGRAAERTLTGAGPRIMITNDFDLLVDMLR
jgi:hypothetical protein